jgi:hypothetical protein
MSNRGSITSGELQGKLTMLEVACHRCERKGRVSLARLIEEHGADKGLPDLGKPRGPLSACAVNGRPQPLRRLLSGIAGAVPAEQSSLNANTA